MVNERHKVVYRKKDEQESFSFMLPPFPIPMSILSLKTDEDLLSHCLFAKTWHNQDKTENLIKR